MEKLHLEDAFEDGPQTRNLLRLFETDALMLRSYAVSLHRCFNRVVSAQKELCAATQSLSAHLKAYDQQHFPLESDESVLSSTLNQFAVSLDDLSSVQQVLLTQLNDSTIFPINKFLKADLDEILTLKEVFQSACDEHERALATYMKFPKKKEQDKTRQDVIDELYVARKKFHQTALHYYLALNCLQYKRKSSLLEPLIGLMNAQKTFFELGTESVIKKETDEFIGNINASVQGVQAELKDASQVMAQQIEAIEEESIHRYYAEPLPDMPRLLPNCSLSQKAGYLYLRTKLTLLSTRWDRCYFFIQGGNLMCQTKDEVAGSPILDLNEPIKVEAIDAEDRRFVFQATQLSSKKTVILQAENALERNEWMSTIENASKESASAAGDQYSRQSSEHRLSDSAESSSLYSSIPVAIPKVFDMLREASGFGRSTHPSTPPSTPSESSFPDAPIQFDIIVPSDDASTNNPVGSNGVPKRVNPFNSRTVEETADSKKYSVRFLGSQQVRTDRGETVIQDTVRQITAARAVYNIFKMTEFQLAISSGSIRLLDPANGSVVTEFVLQDISYWAVHNENKRLFGFITRTHDVVTPDKSTFMCYIFECDASGEEICQTMASATQAAFQLFMQKEAAKTQAEKEKELLLANINKLEDLPKDVKVDIGGQHSTPDQAQVDDTAVSASETAAVDTAAPTAALTASDEPTTKSENQKDEESAA